MMSKRHANLSALYCLFKLFNHMDEKFHKLFLYR